LRKTLRAKQWRLSEIEASRTVEKKKQSRLSEFVRFKNPGNSSTRPGGVHLETRVQKDDKPDHRQFPDRLLIYLIEARQSNLPSL
jgi:hypothetical protein